MSRIPNIPNITKNIDEQGFDITYAFDQNNSTIYIAHMKTNEQINCRTTNNHTSQQVDKKKRKKENRIKT